MDRVIFAEVLDRRGHVGERVRVTTLPFSIGRAYRNDLILEDAYVCPQHAQLEAGAEGGVYLRDLGSRNGLIQGGDRVAELRIEAGLSVRLGHTTVRFRDAETAVPPALYDDRYPLAQPLVRIAAVALLGVVAAVTALGELRETYRPVEWVDLASAFSTQILLLTLWAGIWALITRVFSHRTRFLAHWVLAASYLVLDEALSWAGSYARFLFAPILPLELFELTAGLVVIAALLYGHLTLAGMTQVPRKALLAVALGGGLLTANQLNTLVQRPDWTQVLPYWSQLQPVDPTWLPRDAPETFFQRVEGLRGELDQLAHNLERNRHELRESEARPAALP